MTRSECGAETIRRVEKIGMTSAITIAKSMNRDSAATLSLEY